MFISKPLLTLSLVALFGTLSFNAFAAGGAVKVTSTAQVELELMKDGKKTFVRQPVEKAIPGTEIIFTNTFEKAAADIVINNPIPGSTTFTAGSAFGADCDILFSVDGGKNFGHAETLKIVDAEGNEHVALPKEYTNIRWIYKKPLAAGKSGDVGFRATIN
jgi:hypothetical protein